MSFDESVKEAMQRVKEMDEIDGQADLSLETIIAALRAGLLNPETGAHFDAYVMLLELAKEPVAE